MKKILFWIFTAVFVFGMHPVLAQDQDMDMDFKILRDAARKGDIDAMCDLAQVYFEGAVTLKDPFKAACWAKRAYEQGSQCGQSVWNTYELWRYSGPCDAVFNENSAEDRAVGEKKASEVIEPVTGIRFRYIPRACFNMGCPPGPVRCERDERPAHRACLDGYWVGVHEVTQAQWQSVMGYNPSRFRGDPDLPVENVSYDDVRRFILTVNGFIHGRMELPTEAQWEYACKGEDDEENVWPWPGDLTEGQANCGTCNPGRVAGRTMKTGSFPPNGFKLYDMGGNVMEWCRDYYDKKAYQYHAKDNPAYLERESSRVVRGGSFADNPDELRCSARQKALPGLKSERIGFRLVWIRE